VTPVQTHEQHAHGNAAVSLNRSAFQATAHCLTGCAIGEVLGMVIATALGWGNTASIVISVVLAFFFGYSLTLGPVLRANVPLRRAAGFALALRHPLDHDDGIVDNAFLLIVPGAINAGLGDALFTVGVDLCEQVAGLISPRSGCASPC
jgi:hypothetical protein